MANNIKIIGKSSILVDGESLCCIAFGAFGGELGATPLNDAVFVQTEDLTEACGGITEYGMLVFNSVNSDLEDEVTIACVAGGSEIEATTSLGTLLTDGELGVSLDDLESEGEGGGGGGT